MSLPFWSGGDEPFSTCVRYIIEARIVIVDARHSESSCGYNKAEDDVWGGRVAASLINGYFLNKVSSGECPPL